MSRKPDFIRKPKINFVGLDQKLVKSVKKYFRDQEKITIKITNRPLLEGGFLLFILPHTFLMYTRHWPAQVIFYGPDAYLKACFASGASDYIKIPFFPDELYWRIHKSLFLQQGSLVIKNFQLSPFWIRCKEQAAELTPREYRILYQLFRSEDHFIPRCNFIDENQKKINSRALDMRICRVRKKISQLDLSDSDKFDIISDKGRGYKLCIYPQPVDNLLKTRE